MQAAVRRCIEAGDEYEVEYRVSRPDGGTGWVLARGQAERGPDGRAVTMFGISLDVTARKQSEERQRLLAFEVNHRMKNTLAIVQAIANQTLRMATSLEEGRAAFQRRLLALSKAQDILTEAGWESAPLRKVVLAAVEPYGPARFAVSGEDVHVSAKAPFALSLTLNELATNANKYGSLASPTGIVEIDWRAFGVGESTFEFAWRERGGAPVEKPSRTGFGSVLIERTLAAYVRGTAALSFEKAGLTFRLTAPLDALTS